MPWTKGGVDVTARLICDVYWPDGRPFEGDRGILKRQLAEAAALGLSFNTGPELEFFLSLVMNMGVKAAHDSAGY